LLACGEEFWHRVVNRQPPPVERGSDAEALTRIFRQKDDAGLVVPPAERVAILRAAAEGYKVATKAEAEAKAAKDLNRAILIGDIGENAGLDLGEGWRATFKAAKGSSVAWEKVAREAGATEDLIAKFSTPLGRRIDVRQSTKAAKGTKKAAGAVEGGN
jgi:hypothetical protein